MSRKSRLYFFEVQETMTAAFVIESIEALLPQLSGPTVLVLDNASVHRSKLVQAKRKEWKQKGMEAKRSAPVVFAAVLPAPELD